MSCWKSWNDNSNGIAAVAAIVGLFVSGAGFWFGYHQLQETSRALQASNSYSIQKDARELNEKLQENGNIDKLMSGQIPVDDKVRAYQDLWAMFNFYLSVFRQQQADGIPESFAKSFSADFCGFVRSPPISAAWDEMVQQKRIGNAHTTMRIQWCSA
ncbi:hypothetical protein CWR43_14270 [Rhizobium sullae]|uniref:Uncharacterized protein n=1 Tax=Rhizobium sullae TaxID=50338 RepID=A0A2N0DAT2_RHISU|nr:hypothetical protein [Rhizobium sullae]PKA43208.1 hypothetical protein CWR43_14270 [Rhizobium sullae]